VALVYLGLFLLPLLIVSWPNLLHSPPLRARLLITFGTLTMIVGVVLRALVSHESILMPWSENILIDSGIGPFMLRDVDLLQLHRTPLPLDFWVMVTLSALAGAVVLIAELGSHVLSLVP